ncbi:MAG: hypothetical protein OEZ43_09650 [Gammaproteobacteria bacterium]|nr:hypothetical protein [Gammaproteobacteria bacterium]
MTTVLFIVFVLFIIAGWVTAELNFRTEKKSGEKNNRQLLTLRQKTEKQESIIEHLNAQLAELNEAYEYSKRLSDKARVFEAEAKKLKEDNERYSTSLAWLDKKVRSKEYSGNSLARVIKAHLDHAFPNSEAQEQKQIEESKDTFRRIKKTMGS